MDAVVQRLQVRRGCDIQKNHEYDAVEWFLIADEGVVLRRKGAEVAATKGIFKKSEKRVLDWSLDEEPTVVYRLLWSDFLEHFL